MNNNQTYETTRERSMEELQKMYRYFSIKKAAYEEFDRLDRDVSAPIRVRSAGKVWGMIFLIFGCACIFFAVAAGTSEAFTAVAILIGIGIILLASRSSKIKKLQQDKQTKLQRMKAIAQELAVHYNNYGYCPIGLEYTSPRSLDMIYEVIRQGRADTLKEAINIIGMDEHQAEMERLQRETAQAAWQTCAASRATAGFAAANYFNQAGR